METAATPAWGSLRLRQLRFLLALAEHRNLSRASEAMNMTQPAASRLLADIEGVFGQPLFERGRYGLRPLPAATPVLRFASVVQAEQQLLSAALLDSHASALVRVGSLPSVPSLVVDAIRGFKRLQPQAHVVLTEGTLHTLLPLLINGELDLVVGRFESLFATDVLAYETLRDEALAVVAAPDHPLSRKRRVVPAELREFPWVMPPKASSLYPHFAALFAGLPLPFDVIECASPMAVQAFVQDGRSLGLMSASVPSRYMRQQVRPINVAVPSSPLPLGMYRVHGRLVTEQAAAMAEHLRDAARRDTNERSVIFPPSPRSRPSYPES